MQKVLVGLTVVVYCIIICMCVCEYANQQIRSKNIKRHAEMLRVYAAATESHAASHIS